MLIDASQNSGDEITSPQIEGCLMRRAFLVPTFVAILGTGCGPSYPPPAGFEDACYGGNFDKYLTGRSPQYIARMIVDEPQWPLIKSTLKEFAIPHHLSYFDTSVIAPGLRMINVSLCSSDGIFIDADRRIWENSPINTDQELVVTLYQYKAAYNWPPIANDLGSVIQALPFKHTSDRPATAGQIPKSASSVGN